MIQPPDIEVEEEEEDDDFLTSFSYAPTTDTPQPAHPPVKSPFFNGDDSTSKISPPSGSTFIAKRTLGEDSRSNGAGCGHTSLGSGGFTTSNGGFRGLNLASQSGDMTFAATPEGGDDQEGDFMVSDSPTPSFPSKYFPSSPALLCVLALPLSFALALRRWHENSCRQTCECAPAVDGII